MKLFGKIIEVSMDKDKEDSKILRAKEIERFWDDCELDQCESEIFGSYLCPTLPKQKKRPSTS